ncbi:uncharacterized protein LOC144331493 [Macaca mulatta]
MRFRAALAWGPGLGGGELRRKQLPWGPQRPLRPAAAGLLVLLRLPPSLRLCGAVNLAQNLFLTAQFDAGVRGPSRCTVAMEGKMIWNAGDSYRCVLMCAAFYREYNEKCKMN